MMELLETLQSEKMSFKDILWNFQKYSTKEIISELHNLFLQGRIKKERKENDIIFFYNENQEIDSVDDFSEDILEKNADYHAVSRLARKFRGSRYKVERDVKKKKITFSLKLEKKEKTFWVMYLSDFSFFQKTSRFNDILSVDPAIRLVVSDDKVKAEILKLFDKFVSETFGENGYVKFRENNSFFILTEKEFFVRTTWKRILG